MNYNDVIKLLKKDKEEHASKVIKWSADGSLSKYFDVLSNIRSELEQYFEKSEHITFRSCEYRSEYRFFVDIFKGQETIEISLEIWQLNGLKLLSVVKFNTKPDSSRGEITKIAINENGLMLSSVSLLPEDGVENNICTNSIYILGNIICDVIPDIDTPS